MNVYVAGGLTQQSVVRRYQQQVRDMGWAITCDWTALPATADLPQWQKREIYDKLVAGVTAADVMILIEQGAGRGAFIELGIALATPTLHTIYIIASHEWSSFYTANKIKIISQDMLDEVLGGDSI